MLHPKAEHGKQSSQQVQVFYPKEQAAGVRLETGGLLMFIFTPSTPVVPLIGFQDHDLNCFFLA